MNQKNIAYTRTRQFIYESENQSLRKGHCRVKTTENQGLLNA